MIDAELKYEKQTCHALGRSLAYLDVGEGRPIVLLHGNPTSSYMWRNVIPYLARHGRCLAPDLIGMGGSAKIKPSGVATYGFAEHQLYLDIFLEVMGARNDVVLIMHEGAAVLGLDWARRHPDSVRGIAYMEAIVRPMSWDEWPAESRDFVRELRKNGSGEVLALEEEVVFNDYLPSGVLRHLTDRELEYYREPFSRPGEIRRPVLSWFRQLPVGGEPFEVVEKSEAAARWMQASHVPKLFINADPGYLLVDDLREYCRTFPNQTEVTVEGRHLLPEDSPITLSSELVRWLQTLA